MYKLLINNFLILFIFVGGNNITIAQNSEGLLLKKSIKIMEYLENLDYVSVSNFVHSTIGLKFSPYDREKLTEEKSTKFQNNVPNITKFQKSKLANILNSNEIYTWGNYDGSGFHIKLTPSKYHKRFIYDFDYANKAKTVYIPNKKTKKWKRKWRKVKYIFKAYPKSEIIQFEYRGTPGAAYNDFKNLNLVFEKIDNIWWLIAIVHGEKMV